MMGFNTRHQKQMSDIMETTSKSQPYRAQRSARAIIFIWSFYWW